MTIFVDVLKKLIREDLSGVSSALLTQSTAYGYNHKLSLDQKEIISALEEKIIQFESTGDDKADSDTLAALLTKARADVQVVREAHGQGRDNGKTINCLNKLIFSTTGFHNKLKEFSFNLLNKEFSRTPENTVYFYACYYFGQEIFNPQAHADVEIRTKKERKLGVRLKSLSELIQPTYTLDEQRDRTLQVLRDLDSDNKEVIKRIGTGPALPGLSLFGLQLTAPSEWFSAGKGRFGELFKLAVRKITEMTPDTSDCPKKAVVATNQYEADEDDSTEEHAASAAV